MTKTNSEDLIDENVTYYKGSQFLCMEGIVLWLFGSFLLYVIAINVIKYSNYSSFWFLIFVGAFYFIFSRRMYYLGLSGSQLIIRNTNFFWYKDVYYLNDIKEIAFEQRHNMPVTLRVINNNFTSETYPAAVISDKKWLMLKKDLETKGIKVKNECVSEKERESVRFKFFND